MSKKITHALMIVFFLSIATGLLAQGYDEYLIVVKNQTKALDIIAHYVAITNPSDVLKFNQDEVLRINQGEDEQIFNIAWNKDFAAFVTISVDIEQKDGTEVGSCLYTLDFPLEDKSVPTISHAEYIGKTDQVLHCEYAIEADDEFSILIRE